MPRMMISFVPGLHLLSSKTPFCFPRNSNKCRLIFCGIDFAVVSLEQRTTPSFCFAAAFSPAGYDLEFFSFNGLFWPGMLIELVKQEEK